MLVSSTYITRPSMDPCYTLLEHSLRTRLSGTFPIWVPCADSLGYNQPNNLTYVGEFKGFLPRTGPIS
jgi:hypothetical protein